MNLSRWIMVTLCLHLSMVVGLYLSPIPPSPHQPMPVLTEQYVDLIENIPRPLNNHADHFVSSSERHLSRQAATSKNQLFVKQGKKPNRSPAPQSAQPHHQHSSSPVPAMKLTMRDKLDDPISGQAAAGDLSAGTIRGPASVAKTDKRCGTATSAGNAGPWYSEGEDLYVSEEPLPDSRNYHLQRDKQGNLVFKDRSFTAIIKPDGTLQFKDEPNVKRQGIGASFDLNDALMRMAGDDPYGYEKRRFAKATQKLRLKLRQEQYRTLLSSGIGSMRGYLDHLWHKYQGNLSSLRRILFDLWDECEEAPSRQSSIETSGWVKKQKQMAQATRRLILCFIQQKLPRQNKRSFSDHELKQLNKRRKSLQPFAPYAPQQPSC